MQLFQWAAGQRFQPDSAADSSSRVVEEQDGLLAIAQRSTVIASSMNTSTSGSAHMPTDALGSSSSQGEREGSACLHLATVPCLGERVSMVAVTRRWCRCGDAHDDDADVLHKFDACHPVAQAMGDKYRHLVRTPVPDGFFLCWGVGPVEASWLHRAC